MKINFTVKMLMKTVCKFKGKVHTGWFNSMVPVNTLTVAPKCNPTFGHVYIYTVYICL